MAKKRFHEQYAGRSERREQERRDAGMLSEDPRAVAMLPQQVIMKPYPEPESYAGADLNDRLSGVDNQQREDGRELKRGRNPEKY